MDSPDKAKLFWFVLCDLTPHNASLPAYKMLAEKGIEVFTPMKQKLKVKNGRRIRAMVPVINDLLFAHTTQEVLDPIIDATKSLRYRFKRGCYLVPTTISESEMQRFITAAGSSSEIKYYLPGELTPDMYGHQVRIIGGPLDTFDGKLLKLRGSKKKYIIVELPGLLSVGVEVSPEYITLL